MSKIIIHIKDDIDEAKAISFVHDVIQDGEVSETAGRKHYCHLTVWHKSGHAVSTSNRKEGLNTFHVYRMPEKELNNDK